MNILFPRIGLFEIKALILPYLIAMSVASLFGVIHNQITYSIAPEYFTKFKYWQFSYLPLTENHRLNVVLIGAMTTWWVGLFCAWFLGRWHIKENGLNQLPEKLYTSLFLIFVTTTSFALLGYSYGIIFPSHILNSSFTALAQGFGVSDIKNFIRVAYMHNCVYCGVLVGVMASLLLVKPSRFNPIWKK